VAGPVTAVGREAGPQVYLFSPALDLWLVAGGLSLVVIPFAMLAPPVLGAMVFAFLNLLCVYPHYMATNYRVYGSAAQVRRYKFFAIYTTAFLLLVAIASHVLVGMWVYLAIVAYMILGPYHYTGQNYGIALMYARRGGIDVTLGEKRLLYASGFAFMLTYLLLIPVRPLDITPPILAGVRLPPDIARAAHIALMIVGAACGAIFLGRMSRRAPLRTLVPIIFLIIAQFAWFALPSAFVLFRRQIWLTGISLALFATATNVLHCTQYLGITSYYTKRERAASQEGFRLGRYLLILLVGGALLWPVAMRLFSEVFVIDYGLTFLVLAALINIHHYILDGAIWKLRDSRIARFLVSADDPQTASTPSIPRDAARSASVWRGAAWAAVATVALVVFGADVLRNYALLEAATLSGAQKWPEAKQFYGDVTRYNGRVVDAMQGLAVAEMHAGNLARAEEYWRQSIRLNPLEGNLHVGLGETCLKLGRVDEGIEQLEQAVRLAPTNEVGLRLLARAYALKGDGERAQALAERANTVAAAANRHRLAL
jgi:Flp pilus assembly protein TadD